MRGPEGVVSTLWGRCSRVIGELRRGHKIGVSFPAVPWYIGRVSIGANPLPLPRLVTEKAIVVGGRMGWLVVD